MKPLGNRRVIPGLSGNGAIRNAPEIYIHKLIADIILPNNDSFPGRKPVHERKSFAVRKSHPAGIHCRPLALAGGRLE
jgi:hypothetical protein